MFWTKGKQSLRGDALASRVVTDEVTGCYCLVVVMLEVEVASLEGSCPVTRGDEQHHRPARATASAQCHCGAADLCAKTRLAAVSGRLLELPLRCLRLPVRNFLA